MDVKELLYEKSKRKEKTGEFFFLYFIYIKRVWLTKKNIFIILLKVRKRTNQTEVKMWNVKKKKILVPDPMWEDKFIFYPIS